MGCVRLALMRQGVMSVAACKDITFDRSKVDVLTRKVCCFGQLVEDPRHQVPRVDGGDADCRLIHPKLGGGRARFLEAQADVQQHADVDTLRLHFSGADACC